MSHVFIEDAVFFSPNNGVGVNRAILEYDGESIKQMLEVAFSYVDNKYFRDAVCGGCGPLAAYMGRSLPLSRFLEVLEEIRIAEETKSAKRRITQQRRSEFQRERAAIALRMIDAGVPYICAKEGCSLTANLTIDHKFPVSKGGLDDPHNLQFMCRSHNSEKGDLMEATT